jgi:hypothetical protein
VVSSIITMDVYMTGGRRRTKCLIIVSYPTNCVKSHMMGNGMTMESQNSTLFTTKSPFQVLIHSNIQTSIRSINIERDSNIIHKLKQACFYMICRTVRASCFY